MKRVPGSFAFFLVARVFFTAFHSVDFFSFDFHSFSFFVGSFIRVFDALRMHGSSGLTNNKSDYSCFLDRVINSFHGIQYTSGDGIVLFVEGSLVWVKSRDDMPQLN